MNLDNVLAAVGRMFPSVNLNGAVRKAQEAINGTADSLDSVSATAQKLGLNRQTVDEIYRKYGNTMQGRAICGLLGTTPEALKADADKILGPSRSTPPAVRTSKQTKPKFPRLK